MKNTKNELTNLLKLALKESAGFSYGTPSRRIEGELGGESVSEFFSHLCVFIQYPVIVSHRMEIFEMLRTIFRQAKNLSSYNVIPTNIFLYNDPNQELHQISRQPNAQIHDISITKEIDDFIPGADHRILSHFIPKKDAHDLYIFITDELGCDLDHTLEVNLRKFKNQSIWVKFDKDEIELKKGFPQSIPESIPVG